MSSLSIISNVKENRKSKGCGLWRDVKRVGRERERWKIEGGIGWELAERTGLMFEKREVTWKKSWVQWRREGKRNEVRCCGGWRDGFMVSSVLDPFPLNTRVQNRKKPRINSHLINYCPMSLEVSVRAKRVVQSKQTSERCEQTSERTSEWPSTSVCIFGCSGP